MPPMDEATMTRAGASRCYSLRGPRIPAILALVDEFRRVHNADLERIRSDGHSGS